MLHFDVAEAQWELFPHVRAAGAALWPNAAIVSRGSPTPPSPLTAPPSPQRKSQWLLNCFLQRAPKKCCNNNNKIVQGFSIECGVREGGAGREEAEWSVESFARNCRMKTKRDANTATKRHNGGASKEPTEKRAMKGGGRLGQVDLWMLYGLTR